MKPFLLEIGCEEIPAGYIRPALKALESAIVKSLDAARIAHGESQTFGAPRRLAVLIRDVAAKQESVEETLTGPPVKVAFDSEGKPTIAARKFAEKAGISVNKCSTTQTQKGEYLCAVVKDKGQPAAKILSQALPGIIAKTPFPKSMRWAALPGSFARPVHSVCALLGNKVVPFSFNEVKSGRQVAGHFFMAPKKISIKDPLNYEAALEEARVIPGVEKRKALIQKGVEKAAKKLGGQVLDDLGLLDTVTNLVEYPVPLSGQYDERFLEVPAVVCVTAMAKHQKYFSVVDESGALMPCFIAVNNTITKDEKLAAKGHEKVLRARLEDARFFYNADINKSLEDWVQALEGVTFQAKLGSMLEKTNRVESLAGAIAEKISLNDQDAAHAKRAARLCKADLVSEVVGEFANLQGVMGRIYAKRAGEPEAVAQAMEEHYRPVRSGGELPETLVGAVVAMADKLDSICGCFSVGLAPTGASDPYALRRQAIGVIQILLAFNLETPLSALVDQALVLLAESGKVTVTGKMRQDILVFFRDRMAALLADSGISKETVAAATAGGYEQAPDLWRRARALEKLRSLEDFETLAVAFRRVVNIISQARDKGSLDENAAVDAKLFEHDSEGALLQEFENIQASVLGLLKQGDVDQALLSVVPLRPAVDDFFENVMVMAKEENIRQNRLALLLGIEGLFAHFGDFSKL